MMEVFNETRIEGVASSILSLLGVDADGSMAPPIPEITEKGTVDRVFVYNPDAIGEWVVERYRELFAPMLEESQVFPMLSVVPPVTPVCFASMYSGLSPEEHGIREYVKPVLQCRTVFDILSEKGMKTAIVSTAGDSISQIFLERDIDYFIYSSKEECNRKALELIERDEHALIVLYNGDYDHYMHRVSPEGRRAVKALRENVETYAHLKKKIGEGWKHHRSALAFAPDHGCHRTLGFFGTHGEETPSDMNILHFWSFL